MISTKITGSRIFSMRIYKIEDTTNNPNPSSNPPPKTIKTSSFIITEPLNQIVMQLVAKPTKTTIPVPVQKTRIFFFCKVFVSSFFSPMRPSHDSIHDSVPMNSIDKKLAKVKMTSLTFNGESIHQCRSPAQQTS